MGPIVFIYFSCGLYTMPTHRPQGRKARAEPSSRMGQFYDSPIERVFSTSLGELTLSDFKRRLDSFNPEARFNVVKGKKPLCMRFSRKSCACGGHIQIHGDGRAVCTNPQCSTVFNDGGNIDGFLKVTNHYSDGRNTDAPPPRKMYDRSNREFYRAAKA